MDQSIATAIGAIFETNGAGELNLTRYERSGALASYGQLVPIRSASAVWLPLNSQFRTLGYYPVLSENAERLDSKVLNQCDYAKTLEIGCALNGDSWLAERQQQFHEDGIGEDAHGKMPTMRTGRPFSNDRLHLIRSLKKEVNVFLSLLPVSEPWMIPAYLSQGGWNSCPEAKVQVCFHKRWFENFGAQPIVYGPDYLEFYVPRPPNTTAQALALAEEQYLFCSDIVEQGTETIEKLAGELFQSPVWFFWWD